MTDPREHQDAMDAELAALMRDSSDGLDLQQIRETLSDTLTALSKQAKALAAADYAADRSKEAACPKCRAKFAVALPFNPTDVARAQAHSAKVLDETFRLLRFAQGQADSRPDTGGDWLRALSAEQLKIVQGWIEGAS